MAAAAPDWLRLQQKIFSRWANQKLLPRRIPVKDIVTDFQDGSVLINLLEVLSEKSFGKIDSNMKLRVQKIDQCARALKWGKEMCGISMKVPPSPENLVDQEAKPILGYVWNIMLKYLKFGDDDDASSLNAKDALLLWLQNQTAGYKGVEVKDFGKSLHDGLALCAIIHKHRPNLIPFDTLSKESKSANVQLAMDAAFKYFALEKYLSVDEFFKLDEASMVVYVSEYYYGIATQRKIDMAAKRISKIIQFTIENDKMRAEFLERSKKLRTGITRVQQLLGDRTIDNTMSGAKRRIEEFYAYKQNEKSTFISTQLDLEALYNNLSLRLSHHKRPEFVPPVGQSLKDIESSLQELEVAEQERNIALHAELNRQIKLAKWNDQHVAKFEKLEAWLKSKQHYLETREVVDSVSAAQLQLKIFDAYSSEYASVKAGAVVQLRAQGSELEREHYEFQNKVAERQHAVDAQLAHLAQLAAAKKPVLDDHLLREQFKQSVVLLNQTHIDKHDKLQTWIAEKEEYLASREDIASVSAAQLHSFLLSAYEGEQALTSSSMVAALKALGADILARRYQSQYSAYAFETPEEVHAREHSVDAKFSALTAAAKEKGQFLAEQLANELAKEELRLEFANLAGDFVRFARDTADSVALRVFGDSLAEVEAFEAILSASEADLNASTDHRMSAIQLVLAEKKERGVTDNIYTTLDLSQLQAARRSLAGALDERRAAYDAELKRQQENDSLCQQFAAAVKPFSTQISQQKEAIARSQASLDEQLANVLSRLADASQADKKLQHIKDLDRQQEARHITNNPHTILTAKDVEVQWSQFQSLLTRKADMLREEIELARLRGLTAEQYQDIQENFKRFDKDADSFLSKRELKACLYSLGEELPSSEIDKVAAEYGDGSKIDVASFTQFLINLYGGSESKEETVNGFRLINRGSDVALLAHLEAVLSPNDIQYLQKTAPPAASGLNYHEWTNDVFSR